MNDDAVCFLSEAGRKISKLTIVALFGTIALNLYVIGISLELFFAMSVIPRGSDIQPMDFAVKVFCAFFAGGVFLLPLSYAAFCIESLRSLDGKNWLV